MKLYQQPKLYEIVTYRIYNDVTIFSQRIVHSYRSLYVTAMSKIFELCLATIMDAHLVTSDNQFDFKQKHSTYLCIYTVKSIIQYYNYYNSPVYTCFLDASKAFERINH